MIHYEKLHSTTVQLQAVSYACYVGLHKLIKALPRVRIKASVSVDIFGEMMKLEYFFFLVV